MSLAVVDEGIKRHAAQARKYQCANYCFLVQKLMALNRFVKESIFMWFHILPASLLQKYGLGKRVGNTFGGSFPFHRWTCFDMLLNVYFSSERLPKMRSLSEMPKMEELPEKEILSNTDVFGVEIDDVYLLVINHWGWSLADQIIQHWTFP